MVFVARSNMGGYVRWGGGYERENRRGGGKGLNRLDRTVLSRDVAQPEHLFVRIYCAPRPPDLLAYSAIHAHTKLIS